MHSILSKCHNCQDLTVLLSKIECTLLYLARIKHSIQAYNLDGNFDEQKFKDLVVYKRILSKRIYDCTYPSTLIKSSSIVEKASLLAFRKSNCSECETCFPEINT